MVPESDIADTQALPFFADACDVVSCIPTPQRQPSYIRDHHKRLRHRFLHGGAAAVPDYEFL